MNRLISIFCVLMTINACRTAKEHDSETLEQRQTVLANVKGKTYCAELTSPVKSQECYHFKTAKSGERKIKQRIGSTTDPITYTIEGRLVTLIIDESDKVELFWSNKSLELKSKKLVYDLQTGESDGPSVHPTKDSPMRGLYCVATESIRNLTFKEDMKVVDVTSVGGPTTRDYEYVERGGPFVIIHLFNGAKERYLMNGGLMVPQNENKSKVFFNCSTK